MNCRFSSTHTDLVFVYFRTASERKKTQLFVQLSLTAAKVVGWLIGWLDCFTERSKVNYFVREIKVDVV